MEIEWQQWEQQTLTEQKNKLMQLDHLQCDIERLHEQLQAKDLELHRLKAVQFVPEQFDAEPHYEEFVDTELSCLEDQHQEEQQSHEE